MFIATANPNDPILPALRDRMEVIGIPEDTQEEKLGIAQKYLIPGNSRTRDHREHVRIAEPAVRQIIANYTREAGVTRAGTPTSCTRWPKKWRKAKA